MKVKKLQEPIELSAVDIVNLDRRHQRMAD
jgi:hypothetical protein